MRSKVRLRRDCEGLSVPGTAADSPSGARGDEELPAALRETRP